MQSLKLWQWRLPGRSAFIRGISLRCGILLVVLLTGFAGFGQLAQKKAVTVQDYHLWGTLLNDKISEHGHWVSYAMHYDEHPDTLFVTHSKTRKTFRFPGALNGLFAGERFFGLLDQKRVFSVLDLKTGRVQNKSGVAQFSFSRDGQLLVVLTDENQLVISHVNGGIITQLDHVGRFTINAEKTALVCSGTADGHSFVQWFTLDGQVKSTEVYHAPNAQISTLVWNTGANAFGFLEKPETGEGSRVFYYELATRQLHRFEPGDFGDYPTLYHVENDYANGLTISADGKRVLFNLKKDAAMATPMDALQQWNGNDAVLYPERAIMGESFNSRLVCWWPAEHRISVVTDDATPFALFNATHDYALVYGVDDLKPQYRLVRKANYYLADLQKGTKTLFLENQSAELNENSFSPGGKYYAYFRNGNWWTYCFASGQQVRHPMALESLNAEDPTQREAYPVAGWGLDERSLLVYDRYDLWQIPLEGGTPKRLTQGREKEMTYRIVLPRESEFYTANFRGHIDLAIDLSKPLVLSGKRGNDTGYFVLSPDGSLSTLKFGASLNSDLLLSKDRSSVVFQSQRYDQPPVLQFYPLASRKTANLFQSNPQHWQYQWGRQEIISYQDSDGQTLQGLLYYPVGYVSGKRYPMVVSVYEKQTYMQHYYTNPSVLMMNGFNVAHLTARGYFVLMPDIEYRLGAPGISAADCVAAATRAVLGTGMVLPEKVGLMGHSFGGYETNFIITQTDLFVCAISGASVADLRSWYLSMGWIWGLPESWRCESQQWRMGKSLFDDPAAYERNSPVAFAQQVKTPLLLWSGENDRQIHYYQSIAFYLALRRLEKKEIMLLFPGDGHALLNKANQRQLSQKIDDWLGYFLKDERDKSWIDKGIR